MHADRLIRSEFLATELEWCFFEHLRQAAVRLSIQQSQEVIRMTHEMHPRSGSPPLASDPSSTTSKDKKARPNESEAMLIAQSQLRLLERLAALAATALRPEAAPTGQVDLDSRADL